jgi:hypothetical protein
MTIDGAFGDWANIRGTPDPAGDAILIGGNSSVLSGNIDIADTKFTVAGQALFFYMSANGIMMGGVQTCPHCATDRDRFLLCPKGIRTGIRSRILLMPILWTSTMTAYPIQSL